MKIVLIIYVVSWLILLGAYISSCFFSNFKGLVREYYELTFNGNKVTEITNIANKVLYEYDCGILF